MTTNTASGAADLPEALIGAIMAAAYDFRDAHISGSKNLKRTAHAELESTVRNTLHALAAGQATAAQQGVAYAALPESFLEIPDVQDESGINAYYSREVVLECIDAAIASHGQTPAGAAHEADSVQEDAARLDFLIEQRAYVVSDPDACPGYWLHWAMPDGRTWVQGDEHPTPRAAIDAARKQGALWQSAVRALTLHI